MTDQHCNTRDLIHKWFGEVSGKGRGRKQLLSMLADTSVATAALWSAYTLRLGAPFSDIHANWYLFILMPLVTVGVLTRLGIYRWVVRFSNRHLYIRLSQGVLFVSLVLAMAMFLVPSEGSNPRSLFIIYGLLLLLGTVSWRVLWQGLFQLESNGEPMAIYGAGSAGRQLAVLLLTDKTHKPVFFLDDNPVLQGTTVAGLPVLDPAAADLASTLAKYDIGRIVLAMPSLTTGAYRERMESMQALGLPVQTLPKLVEIIAGKISPDDIRDISIKDILGRSEISPHNELIGGCIRGRCVLVTGGGGSIGSELCRQILIQEPRKLLIIDNSEVNLYNITEQLQALCVSAELGLERIVPILESVTHRDRVQALLREYSVDTVYHVAAYKHVPIMEAQPEQAVAVNINGTRNVLDAAIAERVSHFVLVSTDKAVRPTSSMGASKRVAELLLQARAEQTHGTCICMVRFGNVLGSSGSVVPKFQKQINAGGPVTITHPDITRYFMSIREAAQLVMQASAIARGGEVFVLDMGEPVRITDLATSMVHLCGKKLQTKTGIDDAIAIEYTGLRPGEKMYEELFITDSHKQTSVPKVLMANESWLPWHKLEPLLGRLELLAVSLDRSGLRHALLSTASLRTDILDTTGKGVADGKTLRARPAGRIRAIGDSTEQSVERHDMPESVSV